MPQTPRNTELQSKLEEATLGAVAAKVASDALISALTSQGQELQDKLDASDTKIAELQARSKSKKKHSRIKKPSSKPKARPSPMPMPAPPRAKPGLPSSKKTSPLPRPCAQIWYLNGGNFAKTQSLESDNKALGEQLAVANKKLEIARGVIVALKADVASAQSEIGSLKSELETANNQVMPPRAQRPRSHLLTMRWPSSSGARRRQGRQP